MQKHPVSAVLLIVALAIVPGFINFLSGAYVKKLETRTIMLAATQQGEFAEAQYNAPLAPAAQQPETMLIAADNAANAAAESSLQEENRLQLPHKADSKAPFMAVPTRILAGSMAAREIELLETLDASSIAHRPPFAGKQNWQNTLGKREPDPSNLAPDLRKDRADAPFFIYKIDKPLWHSSTIVVLLHGSGGDEASLMPFARPIWPRATLIGIRGRIMQGKERRWYSKITPTSFNQKEAQQEADNLAQFIANLAYKKHYTPKKIIFVGYSNGANILAIMAMKYPQLVHRAILLRPMPVLDPMPQDDLHDLRILTLSGARDRLYGGFAEPLYSALQRNGARVASYRIAATHMLGREDAKIITRWLKLGY